MELESSSNSFLPAIALSEFGFDTAGGLHRPVQTDQILNWMQHHRIIDPLHCGRRGRTIRLQCGLPAYHRTFPTRLPNQQSPYQQLQNLQNPAWRLNSSIHFSGKLHSASFQAGVNVLPCFTSGHHFIFFFFKLCN